MEINTIMKRGLFSNGSLDNVLLDQTLVLHGHTFSKKLAMNIFRKKCNCIFLHVEGIEEDVHSLLEFVYKKNFILIYAIGGGKVIDFGKRLSLLSGLNFIAMPTILANDGLISPIAVLKMNSGKSMSFPGKMPIGLYVDIDVILNSPKRFIISSIADLLTNESAVSDWELSSDMNGEVVHSISAEMSLHACNTVLGRDFVDLPLDDEFVQNLIRCQLLSGYAMMLAGSSRPCSGSEHLIAHAIDFLKMAHSDVLHGALVGSISCFTRYLQGKYQYSAMKVLISLGISPMFTDYLITNGNELNYIFNVARIMRNRYTILNKFTDEELINEYEKFCKKVKQEF